MDVNDFSRNKFCGVKYGPLFSLGGVQKCLGGGGGPHISVKLVPMGPYFSKNLDWGSGLGGGWGRGGGGVQIWHDRPNWGGGLFSRT